MAYTNKETFKRTWSEVELDTLSKNIDNLPNDGRFEKEAETAQSYVDSYLRTGGYLLPLIYDPFTDPLPNPYTPLDQLLQQASDAITAYFLAQSEDRIKAVYQKAFEFWTSFLEKIAEGKIKLNYPLNPETVGNGVFAVKARPQVFVRHLKREDKLFCRN